MKKFNNCVCIKIKFTNVYAQKLIFLKEPVRCDGAPMNQPRWSSTIEVITQLSSVGFVTAYPASFTLKSFTLMPHFIFYFFFCFYFLFLSHLHLLSQECPGIIIPSIPITIFSSTYY